VLHIAENDQFCPAPAREAIVGALSGRADTQVFVYPGVDHAFARTGGEHPLGRAHLR
jgi:carboxymethylenebutenolidase